MKKLLMLFLSKLLYCQYKYLGIDGYGEIKRTKVLNPESQIYKFSLDNKEINFKIYPGDIIKETDTGPNYDIYKCEDGAYPIQNILKEGYEYSLSFNNEFVESVIQTTIVENSYIPPVKYTPGLKTLKNFIASALQPVGTTLYVFGGGWDFQDLGSSNEARTIGISPNWVKFFDEQNSTYTYRDDNNKNSSYYPFNGFNEYYYAGLDCSGFVGWTIYNNFYSKSLFSKGFVTSSSKMAKTLADNKYGIWMHTVEGSSFSIPNYKLLSVELKVGDILSSDGHVMIVLGKCDDGSFIIIHSTPSKSKEGFPGGGVQLSAVNPNESGSNKCEAYYLCKEYMEKYFKKWSERYEVVVTASNIVFNFSDNNPNTGIFHWHLNGGIISDPDFYSKKTAKEILLDLFENIN